MRRALGRAPGSPDRTWAGCVPSPCCMSPSRATSLTPWVLFLRVVFDLLLDGKLIARGEVVVVDGNYGLRVTELFRGLLLDAREFFAIERIAGKFLGQAAQQFACPIAIVVA
jgi:Type III flagellar switch regulator (C-ring) FliN C-term